MEAMIIAWTNVLNSQPDRVSVDSTVCRNRWRNLRIDISLLTPPFNRFPQLWTCFVQLLVALWYPTFATPSLGGISPRDRTRTASGEAGTAYRPYR
jgi:hypothetical protein